MQQKLEAHKALLKKEMEKNLETEKTIITQPVCSMVISQLGQLNSGLNVNLDMLSSYFPMARSHGDIFNAPNRLGQLINVNSSADT